MLMQQEIILRNKPSRYKLHHHLAGRGSLLGPGLEGDYFETKNEEILIQKLNTLRSCPQPLVIPPLLPQCKSESTLGDDNPETFLHALAVEESFLQQQQKQQQKQRQKQHNLRQETTPKGKQHQQQQKQQHVEYHAPKLRQEEQKVNEAEGSRDEGGEEFFNTTNVPKQAVERIKSSTSFWEYRRDDPNHSDKDNPTGGTLTVVKKIPMTTSPGRIQPRTSPYSSSSPLSVCKYIFLQITTNSIIRERSKSNCSSFLYSLTFFFVLFR